MDSANNKGDEQQPDLPPCQLSNLEDDKLELPFSRNFGMDLSELLEEYPEELAITADIGRPSNLPIMQHGLEESMPWLKYSELLQRRTMFLEHSRFSEDSDSDDNVDDLRLFRSSLAILRDRRMEYRRQLSALGFNIPLDLSTLSTGGTSWSRLKGCESKSGPACLMGDRVVIKPRGADIDMVCYYPTGMTNPTGTLCYMNSVLQAMGVLPLFAVGVALHSPDLELSLLNALRGLYGKMWYPAELDLPNQERPYLDSEAVRTFVRRNSKLFPENLEHDVEELFLYFIDNLERETASLGLGAGDCNLVTRIFSGWTQLPGTVQREYFYSLRLAVHDDRIHSVKGAFFAHLSGKQSLDGGQHKDEQLKTGDESITSRKGLHSKFSVSIDSLNVNTSVSEGLNPSVSEGLNPSVSEGLNSSNNDGRGPDLDSNKMECMSSGPGCLEASWVSASPPPVPQMIIQPPEVLCLCLDRNYIDHDKGSVVYDARPIAVDEEIVIGTAYLPEGTTKPLTYHLRSVISYRYHSWGSGHYVAGTLLRKGLWALCDDCTLTTAGGPAPAFRREYSSKGDLDSIMHFYVRVS